MNYEIYPLLEGNTEEFNFNIPLLRMIYCTVQRPHMTFCSTISVFKGILLNLSIFYCNLSLALLCLFGIAVNYVLVGGKKCLPKI